MKNSKITKWKQRIIIGMLAAAMLWQMPDFHTGLGSTVQAVSDNNSSSVSVDVGGDKANAYTQLASYANNLILINQLDAVNSKKITDLLANAKKAIDNWNDNTSGSLSSYVSGVQAQMDAVISSLPSTTSDFLSLTDTYQTPSVKYGDTVTINLPVVNYASVPLTDVVVRPEISNLVAQWPFEPSSAGATRAIKSFPPYDSSKNMQDVRQDVGFTFKVRDDVMTGYYPLKFDFTYTRKGTVEKATLTTYIKTRGKESAGSLDASATTDNKNISKPRIIVTGFETNPAKIFAGDTFTVTIHVENASSSEAVNNVLFNLQAVEEGTDKTNTFAAFLPTSGSSSIYADSIAPKSTKDLALEMAAKADLAQKPYVLNVNMKYDCKDAVDITDTASVSIPIYQASRCESGDATITPSTMAVGEQANVTFGVYNTGKTTLNNVWVKFKAASITGGDTYLGNITSGSTGNVDAMLTGAAVTQDDGTVVAEISYENESGEVTTVEKKLNIMVTETSANAGMGTDMLPEEGTDAGGSTGGSPVGKIALIIAAVVAAVIAVLVNLRRIRKKKKEQADLDADLDALDEEPLVKEDKDER